jgi:hypothetical protein
MPASKLSKGMDGEDLLRKSQHKSFWGLPWVFVWLGFVRQKIVLYCDAKQISIALRAATKPSFPSVNET